MLSHSVMSNSVTPWPTRLLCPWGFSRQEYWSRLLSPPPKDLPNQRIEPRSPALQVDSLLSEPSGKPKNTGVGSLSLFQGIFPIQELTRVSCIASGFFTSMYLKWVNCIVFKIQFNRAGRKKSDCKPYYNRPYMTVSYTSWVNLIKNYVLYNFIFSRLDWGSLNVDYCLIHWDVQGEQTD